MKTKELIELQSWLKICGKNYSLDTIKDIYYLMISDIQITQINELVYKLPKLRVLEIYNTNIKELNIINNNIEHINCNYNKNLSKINLECKNLEYLFCKNNIISKIKLKSDKPLDADLSHNKLTHFSDKTSSFRNLKLSFNNIKNLELKNSPNLIALDISKNRIVNICLETKHLKDLNCISAFKSSKMQNMHINCQELINIECDIKGLLNLNSLNFKSVKHCYIDAFQYSEVKPKEFNLISENINKNHNKVGINLLIEFNNDNTALKNSDIYNFLKDIGYTEYIIKEDSKITNIL